MKSDEHIFISHMTSLISGLEQRVEIRLCSTGARLLVMSRYGYSLSIFRTYSLIVYFVLMNL